MTKHDNPTLFSRRAVLLGAGALVVSVGAPVGLDTARLDRRRRTRRAPSRR